MANRESPFPRELQPTGLVAVLDRILPSTTPLAKCFRLATFSVLAMTTAWGATFRVAGISVAWAWTHIVHIMNRLLKNRVKAFHLDLIMHYVATKLQYPR